MSDRISELMSTRRPVGDTTHVTTFDIASSSGVAAASRPAAEVIASTLLMSACIAGTIFGNVLVVLSVFTYRPLRGVQNFYIVSLAVADLAVAVLVMPLHVANFVVDGRWSFGVVACHVWLTADILTCTASILNLCAIALDRYRAIHDPIGYAQRRTIGRVLATVAVVWATSAVISVPPLIGWNATGLYDSTTQRCQLTEDRGFVLYSAAGSFYIPLALMTFVYVKIYLATRRRLRQRAKNYRVTATATPASGAVAGGTARATPDRSHIRVVPSFPPSPREGRPERELLEAPSMESLTNGDDYNDEGAFELRNVSASGSSTRVVDCGGQPEAVNVNRVYKARPPSRTDFLITLDKPTTDIPMTSREDRLPEVLYDWRSESAASDELPARVYSCESEFSIDRRRTTRSAVTGLKAARPEVEIAAEVKSNCADLAVHSAEIKESVSMESNFRFPHRCSSAHQLCCEQNYAKRQLSEPPPVRHSNSLSMVLTLPSPGNGSSSVGRSSDGGSQVVDRVVAEKQRQATAKERRVARTMAVIMAAFVVCWLPFFVIYVLFPFCGSACSDAVGDRFVTFIVWLGYVNSTLNPVIYTVFNVDFRRAFKSLLFRGCYWRRRRDLR